MAAGGTFWLVAQPTDLNVVNPNDNSNFGWANGAVAGSYARRDFDFPTVNWKDWQFFSTSGLPAFRIEGYAVPEPSPFALALAGAVGLVGLRCTRRFRR